jgi:hypothetical protein
MAKENATVSYFRDADERMLGLPFLTHGGMVLGQSVMVVDNAAGSAYLQWTSNLCRSTRPLSQQIRDQRS